MNPVVLPKQATRGEKLVILPRKEYETLLRSRNAQKIKKKEQEGKLTKGLREALAEVKDGKVSKAFHDVDELMESLLS